MGTCGSFALLAPEMARLLLREPRVPLVYARTALGLARHREPQYFRCFWTRSSRRSRAAFALRCARISAFASAALSACCSLRERLISERRCALARRQVSR